jgi:hypothetical protein
LKYIMRKEDFTMPQKLRDTQGPDQAPYNPRDLGREKESAGTRHKRSIQWAEDAKVIEQRKRAKEEMTAKRTEHYPISEGSAMESLTLVFERRKNGIIAAAVHEIAKANWSHLSNIETDIKNLYLRNTTNPLYLEFRADVDASKASWRDYSTIIPHAARSGDAYSIVVAAKAHSEMWVDNAGNHEEQMLFLRNLRAIQSYTQILPFIRNR